MLTGKENNTISLQYFQWNYLVFALVSGQFSGYRTRYHVIVNHPKIASLFPNSRVWPIQFHLCLVDLLFKPHVLRSPSCFHNKIQWCKESFHVSNRITLLGCSSTWLCVLNTNCWEKTFYSNRGKNTEF